MATTLISYLTSITFGEMTPINFDTVRKVPVDEAIIDYKTTFPPPEWIKPYNSPTPTDSSRTMSMATYNKILENKQSVFVVLQHSESAGNSALLPPSTVVGIYTSREEAMDRLHLLKNEDRPLVQREVQTRKGGRAKPDFWCTAGGDGVEGEEGCSGYRYKTKAGEDFVVWIEEHELK